MKASVGVSRGTVWLSRGGGDVAAYLLADVVPDDRDAYRSSGYLEAAKELASTHGGRYLARGGATTLLEGDWEPRRMVIIEFPSMDHLMAFYDDPAYQPWKAVRQEIADSRLVALEGYEG